MLQERSKALVYLAKVVNSIAVDMMQQNELELYVLQKTVTCH